MTAADARRWIFTELAFGGTPVRRGGSLFELKPVEQVLRTPEQAHKVMRKHHVNLSDLVLVETLPCGTVRKHWRHTIPAAEATEGMA